MAAVVSSQLFSPSSSQARRLRKNRCSISEPSRITTSLSQPIRACPWSKMISQLRRPKEATLQILRWLRIQGQDQISGGETKEKYEHLILNSLMAVKDLQIQATCLSDRKQLKAKLLTAREVIAWVLRPIQMIHSGNPTHNPKSEDLAF